MVITETVRFFKCRELKSHKNTLHLLDLIAGCALLIIGILAITGTIPCAGCVEKLIQKIFWRAVA